MALAFIKNLLGVRKDNLVTNAIEAIVRMDPKAATEAELRTMEENLDRIGRAVADAQIAFDKEKREAEAIVAMFNQRLAAAELLQTKILGEDNATTKAGLQKSLEDLLGLIEGMHDEVAREKQDAADAEQFLNELQTSYSEAAGRIRTARADLERAERDMARADRQLGAAKGREQHARELAGLATASNGIDLALNAMKNAATEATNAAAVADTKARLLTPTAPEKTDANIAAAMAAAAGTPAALASSADRLAALKAARL